MMSPLSGLNKKGSLPAPLFVWCLSIDGASTLFTSQRDRVGQILSLDHPISSYFRTNIASSPLKNFFHLTGK